MNAQANAFLTYSLRDFKPSQRFGILQFFEKRTALATAGAADAAWGKVGAQAVVNGGEWTAKP
ncbi:MAG: hypothetical protein GZ093_20320 [Rhodoferax sp.]|uniref:hypothetical protein n=1 Tax=Rhodoferax sp. TaxID=50421 RepID=UPI0013FEB175|nr:hypothetical protein [Rhodoferax sp.]NDP41030.1 hypothetical protein [Rhodoferax sp.]